MFHSTKSILRGLSRRESFRRGGLLASLPALFQGSKALAAPAPHALARVCAPALTSINRLASVR